MSKSFHFAWARWKQFSFWAVIATGLAALFLTYGPRLEERVWPITVGTTIIDKMRTADGGLIFRMTYMKERNCTLAGITWLGVEPDGVYSFAAVTDPAGGPAIALTRPVGRNVSRPYKLFLTPTAKGFVMALSYRCGFPWTTRQVLGPFERW